MSLPLPAAPSGERLSSANPGSGASTVRLAVIDADSGFLQVLARRLDAMGWQHRTHAGAIPPEEVVAMRVNAVVVDLAILGPEAWDYLHALCSALPGLGVVVCTGQSTVAQRVRGLR